MDEALYSATYVDNYIDSVENLPDDVQRHLSRIRDIDVQYRNLLRDVDHYYDLWRSLQNCADSNSNRRARSVRRMQQSLIQAQELGDEKMQIVTQLQELIDHKTRQLDTDQKNLDIKEDKDDLMQMQLDDCGAPTPQKQSRTQSPSRGGDNSLCGGTGNTNGYGNSNSALNSNNAGGNSTPNSERSGNSNSLSMGNNSNGTAGNMNISGNLEHQRTNSKRSRRRNDTVVGNMELCGNESNSANEGGSNGGDRNLSQKCSNIGGTTQKKNTAQGQAGTSGGSAGLAGSGSGSGNGGSSAGASSGAGSGNSNAGKKKKRKARGNQSTQQTSAREETPPPDPIDPDEPTYCVCNQISFGEMILCDNDLCPIEWFHFSCVSLVLKPKGKWYCPNCRGDRPNVMKPKAQFLKELERYNKEKEEKT